MLSKHVHEAKGPTSEYWRSPEGITRRIDMLSQHFTYQVVNNSLLFYGESTGVTLVRWVTMADERVCPICGPLQGRVYRKGQFLPPLPAHANCLTPETEVNTNKGLIPIKNIELGDYVLTHLGRYRRVIQLHKNPYEGKTYSLGDGWLTGNHPVLTPKGWTAIDSIKDMEIDTDTYKGYVYNLSVDEDESYTIGKERIIVHNCRCRWELLTTVGPEAPLVQRITLPKATGFEITAPDWHAMIRRESPVRILLLLFTVELLSNRTKRYNELEKMMRNRGITEIELLIGLDDEEAEYWRRRGYKVKNGKLVKKLR